MQIYVCVKHVPDSAANIDVMGKNRFDESIKFIMNPYDEIAVEEALKLKDRIEGTEVITVTLGKEGAINTIRHALAMGADRGLFIRTDDYPDSISTAGVLATVIARDGKPDVVFGGKQSIDSEGMQTLFRIAAYLELPVVNDAVAFSYEAGQVAVERETEAGAREVIEMKTPCVIGVGKGLNVPRYTKLMEIIKAKKKEVRQMDLDSLAIENPSCRTEILELKIELEKRRRKILKGEPEDVATQLIKLLKKEAAVL